MLETLHSERLLLRPVSETDLEFIHAIRSDEHHNLYTSRTSRDTIEDSKKFIAERMADNNSGTALYWVICFKNIQVGTICLWDLKSNPENAELGFEILRTYQGQGLATESSSCVLDHAFQILGFKYIRAVVHRENKPSRAIMAKLGFDFINTDEDMLMHFKLERH